MNTAFGESAILLHRRAGIYKERDGIQGRLAVEGNVLYKVRAIYRKRRGKKIRMIDKEGSEDKERQGKSE